MPRFLVFLGLLILCFALPAQAEEPNGLLSDIIAQANDGDVDAQFYMANLYDIGEDVEQSYEKAAQWYLKAAKQGDRDSQFAMGTLYHDGDGVDQNYALAYAWYAAAIAQTDNEAQQMQDELLEFLQGQTLSEAQALADKHIADYVRPFQKKRAQED